MHVVGARPNFMKVAPVMAAMREQGSFFDQTLVHTGQHYDYEMSQVFFEELGLPAPDHYLNVGSGSHADQTARIMLAFEPVLLNSQPDWVFVVGDVNSTLACSLVCSKLGVTVAHVEAGLRSGDRKMPEEINRLLTDQISNLLFTPSQDADRNLAKEGIDPSKIHFVGNVMIDTLVKMLPKAQEELGEILAALETIARHETVVFPVHPRTRQRILEFGLLTKHVRLLDPQGYLDFLALTRSARVVLTDSGGIQEETTFLGIPCLTLRDTTERPITIETGTNQLVASERSAIVSAFETVGSRSPRQLSPPPLWDGYASQRIAALMRDL